MRHEFSNPLDKVIKQCGRILLHNEKSPYAWICIAHQSPGYEATVLIVITVYKINRCALKAHWVRSFQQYTKATAISLCLFQLYMTFLSAKSNEEPLANNRCDHLLNHHKIYSVFIRGESKRQRNTLNELTELKVQFRQWTPLSLHDFICICHHIHAPHINIFIGYFSLLRFAWCTSHWRYFSICTNFHMACRKKQYFERNISLE